MTAKRKQHSAQFKAKVALAALKGERTVNEIAGQFGVHTTQVGKWRRQAQDGLSEIFSNGRARKDKADQELRDQLYQEIGRLKVELDWLKKKCGYAD